MADNPWKDVAFFAAFGKYTKSRFSESYKSRLNKLLEDEKKIWDGIERLLEAKVFIPDSVYRYRI